MKQILPKEAPIRLEQQDYQKLREQVLRRDGWRCQLCGSMTNLEVHHKQFRSHSGGDDEQNLLTLCFNCHSSVHGQDVGPKSGDQGCGEGATQVSELDLQLPWCRSFSELDAVTRDYYRVRRDSVTTPQWVA